MKSNIVISYKGNIKDKATIEKQRTEALEFNDDQFYNKLFDETKRMAIWLTSAGFISFILMILLVNLFDFGVPAELKPKHIGMFILLLITMFLSNDMIYKYISGNKKRKANEKAINEFFDKIKPEQEKI